MEEKKIVLVTGAARGIGKAIALQLGKQGYTVIVNYNGSAEAAKSVVEEIEDYGSSAEAMQCNVADADACKQMIEAILAKYGRVDVLVNNAGVTKDNLIMRMTEEEYDQVLDVNLKGAFHTIKFLSRQFLKQKSGKIINIASVSGVFGNAGQANYSASKAGLIGLTKSVAKELGKKGVTVNAVAPGFIETDMTGKLSESVVEEYLKAIPAGRFGQAEEVAKAVSFLAGPDSDYITGQVICVDGGMAM